MKNYSVLFILLLTACGGQGNRTTVEINTPKEVKAEEAVTPDAFDASFADGITATIYQYYLKLQMALANSDADDAKVAAGNIAEAIGDDDPILRDLARQVAEADDLENVRVRFAALTTSLEPLFTNGITGGVVYKQYCPMAFDGEGGNWFSDVPDVRNPYYGDKMLKCGKVVAEIK